MSATRPLVVGFVALVLVVGGFGGWAGFSSLAGAIIAPGHVEISQSRQAVQHTDGGVVAEILVAEGDRVAVGDILVRLDGSLLRSEFAIVENQLFELRSRRARLEAQRDEAANLVFPPDLLAVGKTRTDVAAMIAGQAGHFARQAKALHQSRDQRRRQIDQITSQIKGLEAQHSAVEAQIRLVKADLAAQNALLEMGLTEAARVSEIQRDLARLHGRSGELVFARAEAAERIAWVEIELAALSTDLQLKADAELRGILERELELGERARALSLRIARLDMRAAVAGVVFGLRPTTPQSVLRPEDVLMFVVPKDRPPLVVAQVPATHVDEVRPGQEVRLLFSSLPSATASDRMGRVILVSADALIDERTGAAYFRTEIAIKADGTGIIGGTEILPGMPVETFILTGDRSPLSYLAKPFIDYVRNAFRET